MIAETFIGKCKQCGREEHGFIIRMSNQETDAFVMEFRERDAGDMCCIEPSYCQQDGNGEGKVEEHFNMKNQR